jgi:hypothetical protein
MSHPTPLLHHHLIADPLFFFLFKEASVSHKDNKTKRRIIPQQINKYDNKKKFRRKCSHAVWLAIQHVMH